MIDRMEELPVGPNVFAAGFAPTPPKSCKAGSGVGTPITPEPKRRHEAVSGSRDSGAASSGEDEEEMVGLESGEASESSEDLTTLYGLEVPIVTEDFFWFRRNFLDSFPDEVLAQLHDLYSHIEDWSANGRFSRFVCSAPYAQNLYAVPQVNLALVQPVMSRKVLVCESLEWFAMFMEVMAKEWWDTATELFLRTITHDEGSEAAELARKYLAACETCACRKEVLTRLLSSLTFMNYTATLPAHKDSPKFGHVILVITVEGGSDLVLNRPDGTELRCRQLAGDCYCFSGPDRDESTHTANLLTTAEGRLSMRETEELCRPSKKRRRLVATKRNVLIARFFLPGRVGMVRMRQKGVFGGWRSLAPVMDSSEESADWCYYRDREVFVRYTEFRGLVPLPIVGDEEEEDQGDNDEVEGGGGDGLPSNLPLDPELKVALAEALLMLTGGMATVPLRAAQGPVASSSVADMEATASHASA